MKLLRVGQRGSEKPAALDTEGKIRDLSTHIKDLNPENLNFEIISKLKDINLTSLPEINSKERKNLIDFILQDFELKNKNLNLNNTYDSEISLNGINKDFVYEINKIGPFGNGNPAPIFLIKDCMITKVKIIRDKHISLILKPKIGRSIKSICFNSLNTQIEKYLTNYKKNLHVIAEIHENNWNNKKTIQLNIKDLIV